MQVPGNTMLQDLLCVPSIAFVILSWSRATVLTVVSHYIPHSVLVSTVFGRHSNQNTKVRGPVDSEQSKYPLAQLNDKV